MTPTETVLRLLARGVECNRTLIDRGGLDSITFVVRFGDRTGQPFRIVIRPESVLKLADMERNGEDALTM